MPISQCAALGQDAGHVGKTKQQLQLLNSTELTGGLIPTSFEEAQWSNNKIEMLPRA
jgi:hypothetical protein